MSDVQQLKQKLERISGDAKSTADGLSSFKSKFAQAVGDVTQSIGGTATKTDKQIIDALQSAQKQVDAATQALQNAARSASQYANQL